jgi:hypothetical protein
MRGVALAVYGFCLAAILKALTDTFGVEVGLNIALLGFLCCFVIVLLLVGKEMTHD